MIYHLIKAIFYVIAFFVMAVGVIAYLTAMLVWQGLLLLVAGSLWLVDKARSDKVHP